MGKDATDTVIDTTNKFMVGAQRNFVAVGRPPTGLITKDEAVLLAAWLLAMSGKSLAEFERAFGAVCDA
jgi:hypothetical protein